MTATTDYVVDFPTLWVAPGWIEHHCRVPDGRHKGRAYVMADWQLWCTVNHYRVRRDAVWVPELPILAPAFVNRRSQIVGPQKALALDTPIATPDGWTTMADVAVGNRVFAADGTPTTVVSKSRIWHTDTYRVTFSDHSSLVACGDHEWVVERRDSSGRVVPDRLSTREILDAGVLDARGDRRFRVPMAGPLDLPEAVLPIDPYVLGAWLGDGHSEDARITGLDEEVFARIESAGYEVRRTKIAKRRQIMGLKPSLRRAGLIQNKHIPARYLRASEKQRWALLQGLMDTDGHADKLGGCEFTTTLPALRDGFLELARSLGLRPLCSEGLAKLDGRVTGPKWRVAFSARRDMPIFGLARKQERLRPVGTGRDRHKRRQIVAVTPVDPVPTQCLTVDNPSHTFLAGSEMIPTSNSGKGPWSASIIGLEAAGPALFAGWAGDDDGYVCADHGCGCGWEYPYDPGEAMGMPWATPLIQMTANSVKQVRNVYGPLQEMIGIGPLGDLLRVTEGYIATPGAGRIEPVTSSAKSRLGQPVTFVLNDESGLYTDTSGLKEMAETQRRGAAGMGGRTMETTNPWDPSQQSYAQDTAESQAMDIFRFHRKPPANWSYRNKAERRMIHRYVYEGSWWVDLDAIEAEAAELLERDPAQAERFFGNRVVYGSGAWMPEELWAAAARRPERVAS